MRNSVWEEMLTTGIHLSLVVLAVLAAMSIPLAFIYAVVRIVRYAWSGT